MNRRHGNQSILGKASPASSTIREACPLQPLSIRRADCALPLDAIDNIARTQLTSVIRRCKAKNLLKAKSERRWHCSKEERDCIALVSVSRCRFWNWTRLGSELRLSWHIKDITFLWWAQARHSKIARIVRGHPIDSFGTRRCPSNSQAIVRPPVGAKAPFGGLDPVVDAKLRRAGCEERPKCNHPRRMCSAM